MGRWEDQWLGAASEEGMCVFPPLPLPFPLRITFLQGPLEALAALAHSIPISLMGLTLGPDEALGLMTLH